HAQAFLLGARPALGSLVEADDHVLPGIFEVERVRVTLAAIADDRDRLALQQAEVGVLVVVDLGGHSALSFPSALPCSRRGPGSPAPPRGGGGVGGPWRAPL